MRPNLVTATVDLASPSIRKPMDFDDDLADGSGDTCVNRKGDCGKYYGRVYGFLLMRINNHADAQDLAQEAYSRLLDIEKKTLIREPAAYLFTIARNLIYEYTRERRRYVPVPGMSDLDDGTENQLRFEGPSVAQRVDDINLLGQLEQALTDMPRTYAAVLVLRKRDGMTHKEIAEHLGLSPHTVHKYLTRALSLCRAASEATE